MCNRSSEVVCIGIGLVVCCVEKEVVCREEEVVCREDKWCVVKISGVS